jgi:arsenate reductase
VSDVIIYHNPSCSKSRAALGELSERPLAVEVVEYLKQPLDRDGFGAILDILEDPPRDLVRHDARFKELGLDPSAYDDRDAVIDLLVEHPELMQRPIVVRGGRAVIARADGIVAGLVDTP